MTAAPSTLTATLAASDRASRLRVTNRWVVTTGSLILLVPNVLFAAELRPIPAAIMLAGAIGATAMAAGRPAHGQDSILAQPLDLLRLAICVALALALLLLGGEGHLTFANWDWLWRDAVLADLSHAPFPPTYQFGGESFFLRAPLGMYMLPALVAKATSLGVGHAVLLAQNVAFLSLILYLLATIAGRRAALVLAVFVSFSGLDVVGELLVWLKAGHGLSSFALPSHIESWAGLQYSSVATQLFWVPNHALPSYWLALLALLCARRALPVGDVGLAMAAALFWSPFAFIGTLPLAAYLVLRDAKPTIASPRFWLSALIALCFLPAALYMKVDAGQVPHAFLLFVPGMAALIALFLVVEIPHAWIVKEVWADLDPSSKGLVAVAIGVLLVLPTMQLGVADDLVMRASIPPLTILAFAFAEALAIARRTRTGLFAAGLCIVVLGAVTPAQEVNRALSFAPFTISDCDLVTVWQKVGRAQPTLENYLARPSLLPGWLMARPSATPFVDRPDTVCWPDLPFDPHLGITRLSTGAILRASKGAPRLGL